MGFYNGKVLLGIELLERKYNNILILSCGWGKSPPWAYFIMVTLLELFYVLLLYLSSSIPYLFLRARYF